MRDIAEKKHNKVPTGDSKPNSWTLLDFGKFIQIDLFNSVFLIFQKEKKHSGLKMIFIYIIYTLHITYHILMSQIMLIKFHWTIQVTW